MNIADVSIVLLSFFESKVLPNIPSDFERWLTYAGALAKMPALEARISDLLPELKSTGMVREDGTLDQELIGSVGRKAFEKVPELRFGNMSFTVEDFDALMNYIRQ